MLLGPTRVYWAGRSTLVRRPSAIRTYDDVFRAFFGISQLPDTARPEQPDEPPLSELRASETGARVATPGDALETGSSSWAEILRRKRFSDCSAEEFAAIQRLMEDMVSRSPPRRSRRWVRARSGSFDPRRTIRRSLRTGAEPFDRRYVVRALRPRRVVLILDVSGSMSPYSRALLMFGHAALRVGPEWEVFCFGTRLSRLTHLLRSADPSSALAAISDDIRDWGSGTRIGDSIAELLREFGQTSLLRGAIVVVCSDGLDVGAPEVLARAMARLARLARRVIWANPLQEDPNYLPLARGMAAALPHVDVFLSGHNLASLETLGEVIQTEQDSSRGTADRFPKTAEP